MRVTILRTLPEKLAGTALFAGVSSLGLAEVLANARIRHLDKNTIIFAQGAVAERCHILLEGRVRILQTDQHGSQVVMRFIGPGELFGTVGIFTDHLYPAHAVAITDSIEINWTEASLLDLIAHHPQIALNLVKIIGSRLREMQNRLRENATQRVEQRIANTLLRLATHSVETGTTIEFPISRKDIAEICGTTLHTVSRTLALWEKAGWVLTHRRRLTIADIAEIRSRAEDTESRMA